jgi:hypothetical protein
MYDGVLGVTRAVTVCGYDIARIGHHVLMRLARRNTMDANWRNTEVRAGPGNLHRVISGVSV